MPNICAKYLGGNCHIVYEGKVKSSTTNGENLGMRKWCFLEENLGVMNVGRLCFAVETLITHSVDTEFIHSFNLLCLITERVAVEEGVKVLG